MNNSGAYEILLAEVYDVANAKEDRTGTGTISVFGRQIRYNLSEGFPLITSKKVHWKSIAIELLWFLRGDGNTRFLEENGVTIWREWADEYGNLGPVYGVQWRSWWGGDHFYVDQIAQVIESIKTNPDSRRHIVSAWNVGEIDEMALPPCHAFFQFYVEPLRAGEERRRLSCQLYQRSADMFLGVPFNIASYALLTHMIAQQTDLDVGEFVWTGGDVHIYTNHLPQVSEQLGRTLRSLPELVIKRKPESIDDYTFEDFEIVGYDPHPAIKGAVAV
jgi:thymidylate synthase